MGPFFKGKFLWGSSEDWGDPMATLLLPGVFQNVEPAFRTFTRQSSGACQQSAGELGPCFSADRGEGPSPIIKKSQNIIRR